MIAKLAGIPYCPASAIAAAAGTSGAAQAANSSCPAKSEVGVATVQAGTGPTPLSITGKVFLSGPYHGAPLSLAMITPATAGPFDLGTVVVRVALSVNPETAQVTAVSDPIPDVFGGAQLSIRQIELEPQPQGIHPQPDQLREAANDRDAERRWRQPGQLGGVELLRRLGRPSRPPTCEALEFQPKLVDPLPRRPEGDQARRPPEAAGDARSAPGRRQHRRRDGDVAGLRADRPVPHQDDLHARPAGREPMPGGLGLRPRERDLAAARKRTLGPGLPGLLGPHAARPARRPPGPGRRPPPRRDQVGRQESRIRPASRRSPTSR